MDVSKLDPTIKKDLARYLYLNQRLKEARALDYWTPWECKHDKKHTGQVDPFKSTARRRLVLGGNRSGKTDFGAADVTHHWCGTHPYRENRVPMIIKVVGEDFPNHIRNAILPKLMKILPKENIKKLERNQSGIVSKIIGFNGSTIDLMSYDQEASKFESFDADMAWFDEPPPEPIYKGVVRGLLDREGSELFTMTPIKEPWIYNELWVPAMEGKLSETDYFILMTECNPYLKQSAIEKLKEIYSGDTQEARLRGNFAHLSGLVYKNFRRETHVVNFFDWPRDWPVWMCIDPHPKKPHAVTWMGITPKGKKVIIDELKASCSIKELAVQILQKESSMKYRVVDRLIDTSIKALERVDQRQLLQDAGIRCRFPKKHDDVFPGIERVQQMTTPIKTPEGDEWIELVVRENCKGHVTEFMSYVWADGAGNRPNKEFDDYMDNVRYISGVYPQFAYKPQIIHYTDSGGTYAGIREART